VTIPLLAAGAHQLAIVLRREQLQRPRGYAYEDDVAGYDV